MSPAGSFAARVLQAALRSRGIETVVTNEGRDLGVDAHAGGRRAKANAARRVVAARQGAWRGKRLFGRGAQAAMLTRAGVLPQATWGQQRGGAPPTEIDCPRRAAAAACNASGAGRRLSSALAL